MELNDSSKSVPENQATLEIKLYDNRLKYTFLIGARHITQQNLYFTYFSYLEGGLEKERFKKKHFHSWCSWSFVKEDAKYLGPAFWKMSF